MKVLGIRTSREWRSTPLDLEWGEGARNSDSAYNLSDVYYRPQESAGLGGSFRANPINRTLHDDFGVTGWGYPIRGVPA